MRLCLIDSEIPMNCHLSVTIPENANDLIFIGISKGLDHVSDSVFLETNLGAIPTRVND